MQAHLEKYSLRPEHALNFPSGSETWYVCAPRGTTPGDQAREEKVPTAEQISVRIIKNKNDRFVYELGPASQEVLVIPPGKYSVEEFSNALPPEFSVRITPAPASKFQLSWKFPDHVTSVSVQWKNESMARELGFVEGTLLPNKKGSKGFVRAARSVLGNSSFPYPGLKLNTNRSVPGIEPSLLLPCCYENVQETTRVVCPLCHQDVSHEDLVAHVDMHPKTEPPNTKFETPLKWLRAPVTHPAPPPRLSADRQIRSHSDTAELPVNIFTAWAPAVPDLDSFFRKGFSESPDSFIKCLDFGLFPRDTAAGMRIALQKEVPLQETFGVDKEKLVSGLSSGAYVDPFVYAAVAEHVLKIRIFLYVVDKAFPKGTLASRRAAAAFLPVPEENNCPPAVVLVLQQQRVLHRYQCEIIVSDMHPKGDFRNDSSLVRRCRQLEEESTFVGTAFLSGVRPYFVRPAVQD